MYQGAGGGIPPALSLERVSRRAKEVILAGLGLCAFNKIILKGGKANGKKSTEAVENGTGEIVA